MIKNTYYKVMNELDVIIATVETRTEAKKIAKKRCGSLMFSMMMKWLAMMKKAKNSKKGGLTKALFHVIIRL